jgi:hypothetical protein
MSETATRERGLVNPHLKRPEIVVFTLPLKGTKKWYGNVVINRPEAFQTELTEIFPTSRSRQRALQKTIKIALSYRDRVEPEAHLLIKK